jgi:hypothetical protein
VKQKQEGIQHTKARLGESLKKKWESTVMHGQHIRRVNRQLIGEEDMFLWLSRGDLKVETGSSPRPGIINQISCNKDTENRNSEYRLCQQFGERVEHVNQHAQYWQKNHT